MTKVDLIKGAFSRCRISGITSVATPEETRLALDRLEDMAAVWEEAGLQTGYNFETQPMPNSTHNIARPYRSAYQAALALLLLADFGKQAHPGLLAEAASTHARMTASLAHKGMISYPGRQPIGSGNETPGRTQHFYSAEELVSSEAVHIISGDTYDGQEDFSSLLHPLETVASFSISAPGLTVLSSALSSPIVEYRVRAEKEGETTIVITATSSTGQIKSKAIVFCVEGAPNA